MEENKTHDKKPGWKEAMVVGKVYKIRYRYNNKEFDDTMIFQDYKFGNLYFKDDAGDWLCLKPFDLIKAETKIEINVDREEGWISVEERKPEKDKKVWVAFGDKDVDEGMYVDWDGGQVVFVDAIQRWRYVFQPTHWKPFIVPSPPNNK